MKWILLYLGNISVVLLVFCGDIPVLKISFFFFNLLKKFSLIVKTKTLKFLAIKWPPNEGLLEKYQFHDFRTSSWYIDAATSSKDIVILVDSSSSMGGKKKGIAKAIVNIILDTLGNNDFVNIYRFSESATEIVPCFKDVLVQVQKYFWVNIKNTVW